MSKSVDKELRLLERNLETLFTKHKKTCDELKSMVNENNKLKEKIEAQEKKIKDFQNQQNISKIVEGSALGEQEAENLKVDIENYINLIDQCIFILNESDE